MFSLNRATLIGNLGADPEIKSLNSGGQVANFRIATSEGWKDKNTGERREKTEWHSIVVFNENLIRVVQQYAKKGSRVLVEGKIQTRKWQDRDGHDRYMTEIILGPYDSKLMLLDAKGGESGGADAGGRDAPASQSKPSYDDDSIPF